MKIISSPPIKLFCSTLIALFLCFSAAYAGTYGTIILKSGERFENVFYTVDKYYKVIKANLNDSGEEKNFSFHEIQAIFDDSGFDITAEVLGENRITREKEPWLSENTEVHRAARAKLWTVALELKGNYSILMGNYYRGIDPGAGIGGALHIVINPQLVLGLSYGKSWMTAEDQLYVIDPDYEILDQEWTFGTNRYLVSVEYFNLINKTKNNRDMYFLGAGMGFVTHITSAKLTLHQYSTGQIWSLDDTSDENKVIINMSGGVIKGIAKNVGLSLSGSFDIVYLGKEDPDDISSRPMYSSIFDLRAGLCYFIK